MQQVSAEFKAAVQAPQRETAMEISFGIYDTTAGTDASLNAEDRQSFAVLSQLVNEVTEPAENFASLEVDRWRLDGLFQPFPESFGSQEIGWWSNSMSDATGVFSISPILTIDFTVNHSSLGLTLHFDTNTGDCAKEFSIVWYDGDDNLLAEKDISDNADASCIIQVPVENYRRIRIAFVSTNNPWRYLHLTEVGFGFDEVYNGNDLINIQMTQEMDHLADRLAAGKLTFTLDNSSSRFNILNPQGIYQFLQRKQKFKVTAGVNTAKGWQWLPWGEYYLKEWENSNNLATSFTAYDSLDVLSQISYYQSPFYDSVVASTVLQNILDFAGVGYEIDSCFNNVMLSGYIPVMTCREALHAAVVAACAVVRVNPQGNLVVAPAFPGAYVGTLERDLLLGEPQIKQLTLTNQVEVTCYQFTQDTVFSQLYQGSITLSGTVKVWLDYSNVPAGNVTAAVSGATLVAEEYYANGAYLTLSGDATATVVLNGKIFQENSHVVTAAETNIPAGESPQTAVIKNNRLIADTATAQRVASRVLTSSLRRLQQTFSWWADPSYEIGDVLRIASQYDEVLDAQLTGCTYTFNGGLAVKSVGIGV